MISNFSKSLKKNSKRPLKSKNLNKTIKYASNQFLSGFWLLIKFNVESKYDLKFSKSKKITQERPLKSKNPNKSIKYASNQFLS